MLSEIVKNFFLFSMIIPIFIGFRNREFLTNEIKPIWFYLILALFVQVYSVITSYYKIQNLWLSYFYLPLELGLIATAYINTISNRVIRRIIKTVLYILYPLFVGTVALMYQNATKTYTVIRLAEISLFLFMALSYFYQMMQEVKVNQPEKQPFFWINTGVLFYLSGSAFPFLYFYLIGSISKSLALIASYFHIFFLGIFYTSFAIGLWISRKRLN